MIRFLPVALLFACSSAANAMPIYSYSTDDLGAALGGGYEAGGKITSLETSYDESNKIFTWDFEQKGPGSTKTDGFWLVVSGGPNPKGGEEYAILYGDLVSGTATAYVYNGANNGNSWQYQTFLDSFAGAITTTDIAGGTSVSMTIGTSVINSHTQVVDPLNPTAEWSGVSFGNELGLWFHPTAGSTSRFDYDDSTGHITKFSSTNAGWYDSGAALTTTVPEPTSLALLSIGVLAAGCGAFRRRSSGRDLA